MAGDIKRRRFIAAAGGAGLAALVSPSRSKPSAPPAPADLQALHGEALELVLKELKKTPPAGREGLLKLLDLLVRW